MTNYKFPLGISIRLPEDLDEDEKLQQLAASSMAAVELGYVPYFVQPGWVDRVRETLSEANIVINSVHAPFSNEVDISRCELPLRPFASLTDDGGQEYALSEIAKSMEMARQLGARILVVHASAEPIEQEARAARFAQSAQGLSSLVKISESSGVQIAVELLPRTCLGNMAEELMRLVEEHPPDNVGICLDTNHLADARKLPEYVEILQPRLITTHISDYDGIDEKHWMPFQGVVDWGAFAHALYLANYQGAFIYEVSIGGDTLAEGLENVQRNFDRILAASMHGDTTPCGLKIED